MFFTTLVHSIVLLFSALLLFVVRCRIWYSSATFVYLTWKKVVQVYVSHEYWKLLGSPFI
jgi:hypothetical protein